MIDIAYLATGLVIGSTVGFVIGGLMASRKVQRWQLTLDAALDLIDKVEAEVEELRSFKHRVLAGLQRATAARHAKAIADREARQAKVIARHAMQEAAE